MRTFLTIFILYIAQYRLCLIVLLHKKFNNYSTMNILNEASIVPLF